MSGEAQVKVVLALLLMATCAATVLAHEPPLLPFLPPPKTPSISPPGTPSFLPPGIPGLFPPGTPSFLPPGIPGLFPPRISGLPGNPDDRTKCWSSLQGIPGCAWEIYASIFTGKLVPGPACCKALQEIDANCLSKLLPPFFPPLPKSNCEPRNFAASKAVGSKQ